MNHQPPDPVDASQKSGDRIALIEESATIAKRNVVGRRVRVRTMTETVEQNARADLTRDDVDIERVAIDQVVDHVPGVRVEGDVTIVPVLEEVMFVETKLVLKEELRIRRTTTTESVSTPIRLRRQHAVVDSVDPAGQPSNEPEAKDKP